MSRFTSLPHVLVHSAGLTPRLEAALQWSLDVVLGLSWRHEPDVDVFSESEGVWKLQYGGEPVEGVFRIEPEGLLGEDSLRKVPPASEHGSEDLLALIFWMGSRMEEWREDALRDVHGRFDPTGSVPMEKGWLSVPICEQWAFELGAQMLGHTWPDHRDRLKAEYTVKPTLDVDSAYAFMGKGAWRTGGAWSRDVARGQWALAGRRWRVCRGVAPDPYNTYQKANEWHREFELEPQWFFLLARFGSHDKGLPPSSKKLRNLMRSLESAHPGSVQWHPGYASAVELQTLENECQSFSDIMGRPPVASRQHYLRMEPGTTRRNLIKLGIREDHTEGHAVCTGFRGGFTRPRPWYDLKTESLTPLMLHPFAAMDATLRRYLNMAPSEVSEHMAGLASRVRPLGGTLRLLWHNESLAPEGPWKGWGNVYPNVLQVVR